MGNAARYVAIVIALLGYGVGPAIAGDTVDYVVKAGDTCYGIATRELGDRAALPELHRLNPQLGKLPHNLVPGQILRVPRTQVTADAHLTGSSGMVQVRKPADSVWDAALRGMELFRAWRVGALERSSAEVTFRDQDRLQLRENTIVIIYGPGAGRARTAPAEAVLEQGSLRTRLAELSSTVKVSTPSAVATLGAGSALIGVGPDGASTVANHEGRPVELAGKAGGKVAVGSGMGSRVVRGKRPEKPRPLPAPPAWDGPDPLGFAALSRDGATVVAGWTAQPKAAWYRLEILAASGTVVAAAEVPSTVTRFELVRVPPGRYQARLSSIDVDRLEGRPGPLRAMSVVSVTVRAPGQDPAAVAAIVDPIGSDGDRRIDAGGAAPAPPLVAVGGTVGDASLRCAAGGAAEQVAHLTETGRREVRCVTADGLALAPFQVEVTAVTANLDGGADTITLVRGTPKLVPIRLMSAAPLGERWRVVVDPGLLIESTTLETGGLQVALRAHPDTPATARMRIVDVATDAVVAELLVTVSDPPSAPAVEIPAAPPAAAGERRWTAGGMLGGSQLPTGAIEGLSLGDAAIPAYQLASGATIGGRAARWFNRDLFAEIEVALLSTSYVGAADPAWIVGGHAHLGVRLADRPSLEVRVLLGGGGLGLLSATRYTRRDLELDLSWGLTAAVPLRPDWSLRLDGRQRIAPDRGGGVTDVLEASVGLERVIGRRSARVRQPAAGLAGR